jgi:hypothetical protein
MSIITRKVYESWGRMLNDGRKPLPVDVAYIVIQDGQFIGCKPERKLVKWSEIHEKRRREQEIHLKCLRMPDTIIIKPCFVWVFYNSQDFPFGGWWLYVRTLKEDFPIGFRGQNAEFEIKIMQMFPCGVIPLKENIDIWCEAFEKQYRRIIPRKVDGKIRPERL